jgi:hypothetical protein
VQNKKSQQQQQPQVVNTHKRWVGVEGISADNQTTIKKRKKRTSMHFKQNSSSKIYIYTTAARNLFGIWLMRRALCRETQSVRQDKRRTFERGKRNESTQEGSGVSPTVHCARKKKPGSHSHREKTEEKSVYTAAKPVEIRSNRWKEERKIVYIYSCH